jgi:VanZ family protein
VEDVRRGARLLAVWAAVLGYAALIFYFSSRPGGGLPRWWFMRYDKVLHAGEYFGLAALLATALARSGLSVGRACAAAVAIAFLYGVSDEYHQSFVPGRQGNDWGDILADTVGATLGAAAIALLASRSRGGREVLS